MEAFVRTKVAIIFAMVQFITVVFDASNTFPSQPVINSVETVTSN